MGYFWVGISQWLLAACELQEIKLLLLQFFLNACFQFFNIIFLNNYLDRVYYPVKQSY